MGNVQLTRFLHYFLELWKQVPEKEPIEAAVVALWEWSIRALFKNSFIPGWCG